MQRTITLTIICLSLVLLNGCGQQLTESRIETITQDILSVHGQIVAHAEQGDVDGMFEYILDSDETVIQTADFAQTRQESLEGVRKAFKQFSNIKYSFTEKQVSVLTPTTARMFVKGQAAITDLSGNMNQSSFSQILDFVRTDDGWRIQRAHYVPEN